jgi:hypothetical protein
MSEKIVLSYSYMPFAGDDNFLIPVASIEKFTGEASAYRKYLCAYLMEIKSYDACIWVLNAISLVEKNCEQLVDISADNFIVKVSNSKVTFDFALAETDDPEWPVQSFYMSEFKAAFIGWKKLLEMPVSTKSTVQVSMST